jgi:hypothetical protein
MFAVDLLWPMGPRETQDEPSVGAWNPIRESLPMIVSATCLGMMATSLNMWMTQALIRQSVERLVQSDAAQERKIDEINKDLNDVRVELGVHRARLIGMERKIQ